MTKNMAFAANYIDMLKTLLLSRIEITLLLTVLLAIFLLTNYYASSKHQRPFPPGPHPLFLIKNLHQLPQSYPRRAFQEWHKTYGPIICLRYGQQVMISIGSYEVAHDLLEKRKDIYDSRPRFIVVGECMCKGLHFQLLPSGAQWKTHRRLGSNFLSNRHVRSYHHLQDVESKQLLYDLLGSSDFSAEFRRYNLSVITLDLGIWQAPGVQNEP